MLKATFLIKRFQIGFIIDMQPLDAVVFGCLCGLLNQFQAYPFSTYIRVDSCVQNKGVKSSIPGKINKTYQVIGLIGTDKR